jgi:hypothetical protein
MKKSAFILASSMLVISAGAATAGDTPFYDLSPQHFTRHSTATAYSTSPTVSVANRQALATPQKVPTYLLPRELQWMNRPQDTSTGSNR